MTTTKAPSARLARSRLLAFAAVTAALALAVPLRAQGDTAGVHIRDRLAALGPLSAGGERLYADTALRQFYAQVGFRPVWTTVGRVLPVATALASFLDEQLPTDGLTPTQYHTGPIRRLLDERRGLPLQDRVELDLLLSDAFLTAGHDLLRGRVPPRAVHPGWVAASRSADLPAVLVEALARARVGEALIALRPATAQYGRLRQALARYRALEQQGGWPGVSGTRPLHPGDTGDDVVALRERLHTESPLPATADSSVYDSVLVEAVKRFQRNSGLSGDGTVGPATRAALNVTAEQRVRQLVASLERERWLPATLGRRYVAAYIPEFQLYAVSGGNVALTSRVIAGREGWHTPIFSAQMRQVIFNPYWNIPPSILSREVLPRQNRDPGYFSREGIEAVSDGGSVRYRQVPGARNPLGRVKLLFPNSYNVYLHDTSTPYLFARDERALSHGCVRVEKPMELAAFALAETPGWSADSVMSLPRGETEQAVTLAQSIPVYIFYRTAWVDDTGAVQFRRDVYALDQRLERALAATDPTRVRPQQEKTAEEGS